ncbi:hypothetical protein BRAS3843_530031 [Bradyrhizobium sp. STM 3843]|nr:hypothetical protein BRAS3843_530031 [Bradyrhizobium sp. STM 3843]
MREVVRFGKKSEKAKRLVFGIAVDRPHHAHSSEHLVSAFEFMFGEPLSNPLPHPTLASGPHWPTGARDAGRVCGIYALSNDPIFQSDDARAGGHPRCAR